MPDVFKSITRLVYHSNGGFGFQELYSEVPVYVRRFLVDEIENIKRREKEAIEGEKKSGGVSEDMGQAMEKLQKEQGHDGEKEKVQEDLKKVFGEEIDDREPKTAEERSRVPPSKREPLHQQSNQRKQPDKKTENNREQSEPNEDPAAAEDLEQMIDKLKNDT